MITLDDVRNIEGEAESEEEYFVSLQRAINSLDAWHMQGSMGRAMMDAIDSGKCMLGRAPAKDFYGNRIPARDEVQTGTKASRSFVAEHSGEDWAVRMEAVA